MSVFETETVAELCVKQGLVDEALAIYRRLAAEAPDVATRARREVRIASLTGHAHGAATASPPARDDDEEPFEEPFDEPTLTLERRGDTLAFSWSLPPETTAPALQLLLVRRGPDGVETETRTLTLDAVHGSVSVTAPALHSVRAAAGRLDGARFVPLARLRR